MTAIVRDKDNGRLVAVSPVRSAHGGSSRDIEEPSDEAGPSRSRGSSSSRTPCLHELESPVESRTSGESIIQFGLSLATLTC